MKGMGFVLLHIMIQNGIAKCSAGLLGRWMDELAGRFIDNHQPFIFIADVKGEVFGRDVARAHDIVGYDIALAKLRAGGVYELPVDLEGPRMFDSFPNRIGYALCLREKSPGRHSFQGFWQVHDKFCHDSLVIEILVAQHGDEAEGYREDDGNDGCQAHAFKRNRTNRDAGGGDTEAEYDGREHQVDWFVVVDFALGQYADTRCGNDAEQQHRNTAHYRRRNALDDGGELAEARKGDGKDSRTADDPGGKYFGNSQYADVFAIGRVRCGAKETGNNGRNTVAEN